MSIFRRVSFGDFVVCAQPVTFDFGVRLGSFELQPSKLRGNAPWYAPSASNASTLHTSNGMEVAIFVTKFSVWAATTNRCRNRETRQMSTTKQDRMAHDQKAIQEWLDTYCDRNEGVAGGMIILTDAHEKAPVVAAQRLSAATGADDLIAAAKASVADGMPAVSPGQDSIAKPNRSTQIVSLPIRGGNRSLGALALELPAEAHSMQGALHDLERTVKALAAAIESSQSATSQPDAATALQLQAAILSHERFDEAATAFATELASKFNLDRVAIGFLDGYHTTVVAVSRSADFHARADLFRALGEAMDEAIDQTATICFPDDERPRVTVAHAQFVRRHGGSLATIPLVSRGRAFGAVTLERGGSMALSKQEIAQCENIACMIGPILELRRNDERPWHDRLKQFGRVVAKALFGAGHARTKTAVYGGTALLAALLLVPVEYRVSAPARVEGSIQRSLVSPVDGFLRIAYVKPGDRVTENQILVELAEQDLQLERRKRESELAQYENTFSAALARSDRTQFVIAQAKAEEARAQLGLIEEQLSRSRIRAPFDGVVIKGDLSQSLGSPVQKGEVLLTVAPVDEFRIIVEVDERDIADVRTGEIGALALAALPGSTLTFKVERVTPVANTRDGRNFFDVEGKLHLHPKSLRPGLQGVAKIKSEDRSLAWIWTHRFVDWVRLTVWSLGT